MVNAAKPRRPKSRRSRWSNVERPLATGRWLLHRLQAPRRVTLFLPLPSQVSVSFYSCRCIPVCPSPTFHRFPLLLVHRPSYPYTGIRSLKPPRQKAKPAPPPCVRAASSSSFFHPVPLLLLLLPCNPPTKDPSTIDALLLLLLLGWDRDRTDDYFRRCSRCDSLNRFSSSVPISLLRFSLFSFRSWTIGFLFESWSFVMTILYSRLQFPLLFLPFFFRRS